MKITLSAIKYKIKISIKESYVSINHLLCASGITFILISGSYFQWLAESVLFPKRATIMQTAAKGGLYIFPDFKDLIVDYNNITLFIISTIATWPLRKSRMAIEQFVLCAFILSVLMTANDAFFFTQNESVLSGVLTAFMFNALGSILIFVLFVFVCQFITESFSGADSMAIDLRVAWSIFGAAFLLSSASFLTSSFFLRPLDVDFVASFSGNQVVNYYHLSDDQRRYYGITDKDNEPDFRGVTNGKRLKQGLEVDGYNQKWSIALRSPAAIKIFAFKRCAKNKSKNKIIFDGQVSRMTLSLPKYSSHYVLRSDEGVALAMGEAAYGEEHFDIKSGKVDVSSYLSKSANASIGGEVTLDVMATAIRGKAAINRNDKFFNVQMDSVSKKIPLPSINEYPESINTCKGGRAAASREYDAVRIVIKELPSNSTVRIVSPGAVLKRWNVAIGDLLGARLGVAGFFASSSDGATGLLDQEKFSAKGSFKALWLQGLIRLHWSDGGDVTAKGVAEAAWFDGKMGSQTKWESLGDEWQRWAIGGMIAAFIFSARYVLKGFWLCRLKRLGVVVD